jgi:PAS domain S-box-containing protein
MLAALGAFLLSVMLLMAAVLISIEPEFVVHAGMREAKEIMFWLALAAVPATLVRYLLLQRKIDEARDMQQHAFRAIAENAPDPIARYDRHCRCLYMNPALKKLLGASDGAYVGKRPSETNDGAPALHLYEEKIKQVVRTGQGTELELTDIKTAPGARPVWDHVRLTPEFDGHGRVESVLAIGRDISRLKDAEYRLKRSRALLRTLLARQERDSEAERKRLSWEVHEELGQILMALRINLEVLSSGHPGGDGLREKIRPSRDLLDRSIRVVRNLSSSLRPSVLDLDVSASLEWLADGFMRRTGTPCLLEIDESVLSMDEENRTVVFRIAQEALDNIERHAEAQTAELTLRRMPHCYFLRIKDVGKGFDLDNVGGKGFGLLRMRERVSMLGGEIRIFSSPGRGTVVDVFIPDHAGEGSASISATMHDFSLSDMQ